MVRLLPVGGTGAESEDSSSASLGSWVGVGLKRTIQGVDAVAGAVGTARRWRSGGSEPSSRARVQAATAPGEDVSPAAIRERGEPDVQAESPEPGEMIVDQDVVGDVVEDAGTAADPGTAPDETGSETPGDVTGTGTPDDPTGE